MCNEVLEQTMTVELPRPDNGPVLPERGAAPANGFHNFPTHLDRVQSEIVAKRFRWPLVEKFVRANGIDRVLIDNGARKLGIVATGKAVQDGGRALKLLSLEDGTAQVIELGKEQARKRGGGNGR